MINCRLLAFLLKELLQADTKVSYGTVASVMASIEHAGISKLSVLTIAK